MSRAAPKRFTLHATRSTILLIVTTLFLSVVLWMQAAQIVFPWQEKPLRVWMLDIGQGDAFFIEFPTGEQWLIDGGPDDAVLAKLGSLLLPWDRTLDAILVTHPDADHMTGFISLLDRYQIDHVYETGAVAATAQDRALVERVANEPSGRELLSSGDVLKVGTATLTVVWPQETHEGDQVGNRNNTSLVVRLDYGETSVLFTGDAEEESEIVFANKVGDIDVLKVGHHGSLSSTSWNFLAAIAPEVALISAGEGNPYGHPHPVILNRLLEWGSQTFRTDLQGDILVTSYGDEPQVQPAPLPF